MYSDVCMRDAAVRRLSGRSYSMGMAVVKCEDLHYSVYHPPPSLPPAQVAVE